MSRYPRLVAPGYPHHITQRGVRRQKTFFDDDDYQTYLNIAAELTDEWEVEFWAYCLMPNHMHAVVVPQSQDSLSKYFAALHRRYARKTNQRYEWLGHLWQKRFYSVAMDERHTFACLRYVEFNPVRSGLCAFPHEWPWSSTNGNLGLTEDPLIDRTRTVDIIANWSAYLTEENDPSTIQRLRQQTSTGRPGGDDGFLTEIESKTGRRVRKRRPGRKKK